MTDEQQRPRPPQPAAVQHTAPSSAPSGHGGAPTAAETTQQIPTTPAAPAPPPPAPSHGYAASAPHGAPGQQGAAGQHGAPAARASLQPGAAGTGGSFRTILHVLALVLVAAGISLPLDGDGVLWTASAAWAAFAAVAALAQLVAVAGRDAMGGHAWWVGAAGAAGLVLFWALLMLPVISTNMAFLVTLGTAAAVVAVLMSPDRRV